ncbi:MAG: hypothetical protein JWN08_3053 [Frankiales bacterium]|nr:hypothetical protein [Frankiales bacterium]
MRAASVELPEVDGPRRRQVAYALDRAGVTAEAPCATGQVSTPGTGSPPAEQRGAAGVRGSARSTRAAGRARSWTWHRLAGPVQP